jgi:hypothetical protein
VNIISSPPGSTAEEISTGHAAGKTLFCRQLRFCLGEESFADPEDTVVIREKFRDGGIGAEIRLGGETWVVRRAFSTKADDRATKSDRFEDLADDSHRETFDAFRNELETLALSEAQRQLVDGLEKIEGPWQYVLAWLTRDQECRLDGLTHWRHPDSSSHSPAQSSSAETRLSLVRVVLGLYSEHSNEVRQRVDDAARAVRKAASDTRMREERFNLLRADLAKALGLGESEVWPPPQELLQNEQSEREAHFRRLENVADERIRAVRPIEISDQQRTDEQDFERASADCAKVDQQIEASTDRLRLANARLELHTRTSAEAGNALGRAKHPTCPYDDTPLDVERAQFVCPLPKLPEIAAAQRAADEAEEYRARIADDVAAQQESLAALKGQRATLQARIETLRRRIAVHQLSIDEASEASQAAWAAKSTLRRFADAVTDFDEAKQREEREKRAEKVVADQQKADVASHSNPKLKTWFDFLVRRIVASEATGEIKLDGHGLHPTIQWRGRRRSVALNSLRVVLFDIAAMLCAVEGAASAPAFLIHDSPREGDLDPWTYARLFETVLTLGPSEDSAPFQYIVTTTTEPPEGEVRRRVRDQFSSKSSETRFFKADL